MPDEISIGGPDPRSLPDLSISAAADGMAAWQEHRPQTMEDWQEVTRRFSEEADRLQAENERLRSERGQAVDALWWVATDRRLPPRSSPSSKTIRSGSRPF